MSVGYNFPPPVVDEMELWVIASHLRALEARAEEQQRAQSGLPPGFDLPDGFDMAPELTPEEFARQSEQEALQRWREAQPAAPN